AYRARAAHQLPHAAGGTRRQGSGRQRGEAAHPDRPGHGRARLRIRGGLERHQRDGGAFSAYYGSRGRDTGAGDYGRRPGPRCALLRWRRCSCSTGTRLRVRAERANILLSIDSAIADNDVMDNETKPGRSWWKWAITPPQSYLVYLVALVLVYVLSFYAGTL